jgi:branched-chain amino acid transport system permease protein
VATTTASLARGRVRPGQVGAAVGTLAIVVGLLAAGLKQALVIGLITGAAYGLVALGLVLIYKSSGVFNFAQGEFGTVAVYALYLLHSAGVPYLFAMIGALIVAVVMGLVVERFIIRPLFDAARVTLLVATAGVALLAIGVEVWFGEAKLRRISPALPRFDRVSLFGVQLSDQRLLLLVVLVVLGMVLALFFSRTNLGLAILGASQDAMATELAGISVRRLSSFTWALAALLGGLAGVLAAPIQGNFSPGALTFGALIPGFTAAVLGGMNSLPGAFVGGTIVGVAQSVAVTSDLTSGIPGAAAVAVFVLLLVVLIVRPQGLLGRR